MGCSLFKETEDSLNKEGSILNCEAQVCTFKEVTRNCYKLQTDLAEQLKGLADDLDKLQTDVKKAKVGLAVASVAVTATGIGLSFFTLGGSALVLTLVGVGLGVASGAGGIAEKVIKGEKMKEVNKVILAYSKAVLEYAPVLQRFCDSLSTDEERERLYSVLTDSSRTSERVMFQSVSSTKDLCKVCKIGHKIITTSLRVKEVLGIKGNLPTEGASAAEVSKFSLTLVTEASSLTSKTLKSLSPLTNAVKIGSHVLSGIGLILDIGTIVYYSLKIHKKQPSEVAQLLRTIASAFEIHLD